MVQLIENLPASAGAVRRLGPFPGSGSLSVKAVSCPGPESSRANTRAPRHKHTCTHVIVGVLWAVHGSGGNEIRSLEREPSHWPACLRRAEACAGCPLVCTRGSPAGPSGREYICQCRRRKRHGFNPWVRNVSWSRRWQPTVVFLPRESRGQRSLVGYSPWGPTESDKTEVTQCTHMNRIENFKTAFLPFSLCKFCFLAIVKFWFLLLSE